MFVGVQDACMHVCVVCVCCLCVLSVCVCVSVPAGIKASLVYFGALESDSSVRDVGDAFPVGMCSGRQNAGAYAQHTNAGSGDPPWIRGGGMGVITNMSILQVSKINKYVEFQKRFNDICSLWAQLIHKQACAAFNEQNMKTTGQEIPKVFTGEAMKTQTIIQRLQSRHLLNYSDPGVLVEDKDEKALEISWNMNTVLCGRNKYQQTWSGFCCHSRWVLFIFSISSPPDIPGTNHLRLNSAPIASLVTFSALILLPFFFICFCSLFNSPLLSPFLLLIATWIHLEHKYNFESLLSLNIVCFALRQKSTLHYPSDTSNKKDTKRETVTERKREKWE